eukprot:910595-Rhodomonas_salina.2
MQVACCYRASAKSNAQGTPTPVHCGQGTWSLVFDLSAAMRVAVTPTSLHCEITAKKPHSQHIFLRNPTRKTMFLEQMVLRRLRFRAFEFPPPLAPRMLLCDALFSISYLLLGTGTA